jgi:CheY-like chemotaxis protein/HPt (histidine-containing phosphotransfer) domain-containing protein
MRSITKLILDYDDDFAYLGSDKDKIFKVLEGKKIILADDQDLNRVMTKKILEKYQVICVEARNGNEISTLYKESLDKQGKSSFDAIVTDINMPPFDGDDAAVEIRGIEHKNAIAFHDRIPIIALSGDSSPSAILGYFKVEMNDYFIKGKSFENLIKILANFFIEDVVLEDFKSLEGDKISHENQVTNSVLSDDFINNFNSEERSRIIGLFIEDGNQIISKIKLDCVKDDQEALNSSVHSLKGIVANIGAKKLFNYIKNIEKIISSENFKNIENHYKDLINELEKYKD